VAVADPCGGATITKAAASIEISLLKGSGTIYSETFSFYDYKLNRTDKVLGDGKVDSTAAIGNLFATSIATPPLLCDGVDPNRGSYGEEKVGDFSTLADCKSVSA